MGLGYILDAILDFCDHWNKYKHVYFSNIYSCYNIIHMPLLFFHNFESNAQFYFGINII